MWKRAAAWRPDVPWRVRDAFVVFFGAWIGLPLLTQLVLVEAAKYSRVMAHFNDLATRGDVHASFVLVIIDALFGLGLVWLYLRKYQSDWLAVGLRRFNLWQAIGLILGVYIGFIFAIYIVFAIVSALVPAFNSNQAQTNEFTSPSADTRNLSLIALVIIPPILEEIVFRGFMFGAFAKRWGVIMGAILSSGLFAVAHLQFNVSLYTFILGLLLCMMYYKLRSIWPGIFFHALNNYLAFMVAKR